MSKTEQLRAERELIQKKTFTKWANSHLVKSHGQESALKDVKTDFASGIPLMQLINSLYGTAIPKYNAKPKMRAHQLDNIGVGMQMLDTCGVKTNFLKPVHLVDGDQMMILGMLWSIILDYQIKGISVEELSAKEGLLLWCQKKTKGYRDVEVREFTNSWRDGLAFCALIHAHRPDLIPYETLNKANRKENLALAFSVAQEKLGITALLDVEDMDSPDERSVITYLSEYFHFFSSQNAAETAGRRIAKIIKLERELAELKDEYAGRARSLVAWLARIKAEHSGRNFGHSLAEVEASFTQFIEYKKTEKPQAISERLTVEGLFNTLQAKLRVNGRKPYEPPSGLSLQDIGEAWDAMATEEQARDEALREELARMQRLEGLVARFGTRAATLEAWASDVRNVVSSRDLGGDSLAGVSAKLNLNGAASEEIAANATRLSDLNALATQIEEENYKGAAQVRARVIAAQQTMADLNRFADEQKASLLAELERQQQLEDWRVAFAKGARAVSSWVDDAKDALGEPVRVSSVAEAQQAITAFQPFAQALAQKTKEVAELRELETKTSGARNIYTPLTASVLEEKLGWVKGEFAKRTAALDAEAQRQAEDEKLRLAFAGKANALIQWSAAHRKAISEIAAAPGDANAHVAQLGERKKQIFEHTPELEAIHALSDQMNERHIVMNPHTVHNVETLSLEFKNLSDFIEKAIQTIERELLNLKMREGVSAEQLAEFQDMFRHFDKSHNNKLEKYEFKACLASLGYHTSDAEVDKLFNEVGKAEPGKSILIDEFVSFMVHKTEDSDSANTINAAFKELSGKEQFVSEAEVRRFVDAENAEFLLKKMRKVDNNLYDYGSFVNGIYA